MDLLARLSAVSSPSSHVFGPIASLNRTIKNLVRHIIGYNQLCELGKLFTLVDSLQLPFPVSERFKSAFALKRSMLWPQSRPVTVVVRLSDMERIEIIYEKRELTVRHTIEISSESLWLRTLYVLRSFAV